MGILEFVLYIAGGLIVLTVLGCIFSSKFREKVLLTLGVRANKALDSMTTAVERVEARVEQLSDEVKRNSRRVSDLKGQLNHEKNILKRMQDELSGSVANYKRAKAASEQNPDDNLLKETVNHTVDEAERKRTEVTAQEGVVAHLQEAVDTAREAIARATSELKKLQSKVATGAAKAKASAALSSAADVLEATKDVANRTSGIGKDLDAIDLGLEQSKARLEDAQGSDVERKLRELQEQESRSGTRDWLDKQ